MASNPQWSDESKREAATHYAITGSLVLTSKATGIPEPTLCDWSKGRSDKHGVFIHTVEEARSQKTTEFIAKYEAIAAKSLDLLNDRIEHDDVRARDLITVAGISTDKALILAGKPNRVTANQGVQELAKMFESLSRQHARALPRDTVTEGQMGPMIDAPKGQSEPD